MLPWECKILSLVGALQDEEMVKKVRQRTLADAWAQEGLRSVVGPIRATLNTKDSRARLQVWRQDSMLGLHYGPY